MSLDLRSLIGRLNTQTRRALEGAAGLCMSLTHYEVELEHWLVKLLEDDSCDVPRVLRHFGVDPDRARRGLERALEGFKSGNGRRPDLAPSIEMLIREGWLYASVNLAEARVRSATLLLAALSDVQLRRRLIDAHGEFRNLSAEALQAELREAVAGSSEDAEAVSDASATRGDDVAPRAGAASRTPALDQYTLDLTASARAGRIDPVLGRDDEIRLIIDVLMRRRQNNPILTGEAGVGKTSVVEGFALAIASEDVPEPLRHVVVRTLDLGLLEAGAGVKGEFENRLKQVIAEVKASPVPIVLFIDEAHTMIGAGGQQGQNDAANLLKPALARGELRTIAATTWSEYKKYFEKDAALARRFQVIKVEEPDLDAAIEMMRGLVHVLESHHRVRITDAAVVSAVKLSSRYIPARQLPDKSVSVLDTAAARVAISLQSVPPQIQSLQRQLGKLERERDLLERESDLGVDHRERLDQLEAELRDVRSQSEGLHHALDQERAHVVEIQRLRTEIEARRGGHESAAVDIEARRSGHESVDVDVEAPPVDVDLRGNGHESAVVDVEFRGAGRGPGDGEAQPPATSDVPSQSTESLRHSYQEHRRALAELQGERGLLLPEVDSEAVAEVISGWTGIPVGRMVADEIHTVLELADRLGQRVLGQDAALETIARRIRTARAGLDNPSRPVGVFLLAGPSGVGKTETALALAEALYGGERNSVVINMSEYQEPHTVSGLKGSPPGYVGYGEGGVLTEAVRRRPYSVVLLDEVEKAHPDVLELFLQVFDKGVLEDAEGREVDFRNTVILLTSNVGSEQVLQLCADPELLPEPAALATALRPVLRKHFPAAFLGRLVVVPYYPIDREGMANIARLQIDRIRARTRETHRAELGYSDAVIAAIADRCTESETGARAVDQILTHSLLPQISSELLARMATHEPFARIEVSIDPAGEFALEVS